MIHKMLDSTRSGMTRTFSHVPSIYDNDFLELVWENGEVVVRGGSSNRSTNTNHDERIYEDAGITKTRLNPFDSLEAHFAPQRGDSDMSSSHQSCAQDSSQSSQNKNSSKLDEQFANLLRPVKDSKPNNSHCLPSSSPLKKQRSDSTQTPPATNTRNLGCECHHKTTKSNFYNFSIPAVFVKSTTHQGNSATQQTKQHSSLARVEEIEALKVEKSSQGFQNQTSLTVERSERPPPPVDEHSQAIGLHTSQAPLRSDQNPRSEPLRTKPKAYNNTDMCHEPLLASSSVCSLGASNDPNLSIRKHEDTDDSTYLSDNEGEPEDMVKQEREGSRVKRSRNAEVHNLSEQKRREKINKKMRTLKELIPNCNKVDKASMLDDAIDYLKTLKLQLQIMSMGNGLWPYMMLPAAAAHHMNGAHLPQLVGAGMGFRPPQLPIPPLSAITDNRLQMVGFPNQIAPISMPHAPFFPIIGNSATQPHLASTTVATANLAEHLANSASSLQISVPNNMNPLEHTTKQAPNQVSFQHHINSNPQLPLSFFHKSRGM